MVGVPIDDGRAEVSRVRGALTPPEWRRVALLVAAVAGLHAVGFGVLIAAQHQGKGAGGAFGFGIGVTAYTLGLRHAVDADHLAAIDNTARRLMRDGQRPLGAGFFFSLGHSTIVFVVAVLIACGARGLSGAVADERSTLHVVGGLLGPAVSGSLLLVIGLLNLPVLVGILGMFGRMRRGALAEAELADRLEPGGVMSRFYRRSTRAVRRSWQMYPLGLLFGLGFDTATEVALLVLAGVGAASGVPAYAVLCLPVLFAAGMSLLDTIDGAAMTLAYGWAFARPIRRLFCTLVITGLSVAVALLVAAVELLTVLAGALGLTGGLWGFVSELDLDVVGYGIAALFAVTWPVAVAVWRLGRIEERWSAPTRAIQR
jgi:high-affinity nickel-transport protein